MQSVSIQYAVALLKTDWNRLVHPVFKTVLDGGAGRGIMEDMMRWEAQDAPKRTHMKEK